MLGMVPDNDIQGHSRLLLRHLNSESWRDLWHPLDITIRSFASLGLLRTATDRLIWRICQQQQVILVTGNRNNDGPDSLTATIGDSNTPQSLPVLTLANMAKIRHSKPYAELVAEKMLDTLLNLDNARGAGRIWLP